MVFSGHIENWAGFWWMPKGTTPTWLEATSSAQHLVI